MSFSLPTALNPSRRTRTPLPRKLLVCAALLAGLGLGAATQTQAADVRVYVSFGDVVFSHGRPYHRHHHYPLHVVHAAHGPMYYYITPPAPYPYVPVVAVPVHGHAPYHTPTPPSRPGYHRQRPGY